MKRLSFLVMFLLFIVSSSVYAGWQEILQRHQACGEVDGVAIVCAQYGAYVNGVVPHIADPVIKDIAINETNEPLVEIGLYNPRITMLPNPKHAFESPEHNSGLPAARYVRRTLHDKLDELLLALDRYAVEFGYTSGQISIKVFEGLRDINTQNKLFEQKAKEIAALNPSWAQEQVLLETAKWVSPTKNNIPAHSTGGAVDLRLYDNKANRFVDMGKFGVIWGPNDTAPTFADGLTDEQISNRLFLLLAAAKVGLVNYPNEYWHFSVGDRYAAYWLQEKPLLAFYSSVGDLHKQ